MTRPHRLRLDRDQWSCGLPPAWPSRRGFAPGGHLTAGGCPPPPRFRRSRLPRREL